MSSAADYKTKTKKWEISGSTEVTNHWKMYSSMGEFSWKKYKSYADLGVCSARELRNWGKGRSKRFLIISSASCGCIVRKTANRHSHSQCQTIRREHAGSYLISSFLRGCLYFEKVFFRLFFLRSLFILSREPTAFAYSIRFTAYDKSN